MLVETEKTICTTHDLTASLIKAWYKLYGSVPKKESICIILAQHQLETGNNYCWNWNLTNVKYVPANGDVDWIALDNVWEIINGKRVVLSKNDPGSRFRAFKTIDDGAEFYLNFLHSSRYRSAWSAIVAGSPDQFSHLLKMAGFYTADETQYTKIVVSSFNMFMNAKTFETVMSELQGNFSQIEFPDDYKPIDN